MTSPGDPCLEGAPGMVPWSMISSAVSVGCLGSLEGRGGAARTLSSSEGSTDPNPQDAECRSQLVSDLDGGFLVVRCFNMSGGNKVSMVFRSLGRFIPLPAWQRTLVADRIEQEDSHPTED